MKVFERNYELENNLDDETKAIEALKLKQWGHELNCRFCGKQFETKELFLTKHTGKIVFQS